ncbi:hypothetical protein LEP1GSC202_1502 [Leptospira yanagawae serovar Saopaulo str. Sao Paulo = ATCC 700523]|uniref:Uncharacterized protein n=1 Tax=Leptospira yanagawae serovar Saopaulo str. Sao Paulo = ATCC 700523 TaxID=1249483 RepID=A0A5E8HEZ3_9LEPT|nr:hypothetical protein LEP1GSC202_1502 [Leptospira yanagawae serovar Saopaulo str. Sao Paulo = ATCC 700523]
MIQNRSNHDEPLDTNHSDSFPDSIFWKNPFTGIRTLRTIIVRIVDGLPLQS